MFNRPGEPACQPGWRVQTATVAERGERDRRGRGAREVRPERWRGCDQRRRANARTYHGQLAPRLGRGRTRTEVLARWRCLR